MNGSATGRFNLSVGLDRGAVELCFERHMCLNPDEIQSALEGALSRCAAAIVRHENWGAPIELTLSVHIVPYRPI